MTTADRDGKYLLLLETLRGLGSALVAFSGGVDSAFLLAAAREALGDAVLAVTARSASYPEREGEDAARLAGSLGVRHRFLDSGECSDPSFRMNPPDRCYHCKRVLFAELRDVAAAEGIAWIVEGSNLDDEDDYRPGRTAVRELGIRSPLAEARLGKQDIRALARTMGLPVWDKPALACLASRVPYGEEITEERLARIGRAEDAVRALGFRQVRVRDHGLLARIEVGPEELGRFGDGEVRLRACEALEEAGYTWVTLDLKGYRTGAMNEMLTREGS